MAGVWALGLGVVGTLALTPVLLAVLLRRGDQAEGGRVFVYVLALRVACVITLLLPFAGTMFVLLVARFKSEFDAYGVIGVMAGMTLFGAVMFWETMRWSLVVDDAGMWCHSPWRAPFFIAWTEVREVTWVNFGLYFVVKGEGQWFRIHQWAADIRGLLAELARRLPAERLVGASEGYLRLGLAAPTLSGSSPGRFDLRKWGGRG